MADRWEPDKQTLKMLRDLWWLGIWSGEELASHRYSDTKLHNDQRKNLWWRTWFDSSTSTLVSVVFFFSLFFLFCCLWVVCLQRVMQIFRKRKKSQNRNGAPQTHSQSPIPFFHPGILDVEVNKRLTCLRISSRKRGAYIRRKRCQMGVQNIS